MKIILSRKGFDSGYGGVASPILPNGALVSLPIPSGSTGAIRYDRQYIGNDSLGKLVTDLTRGKYTGRHKAHLDPDLCVRTLRDRPEGWRAIFGQAGAAQSHLAGAGIGPSDLFLFFGWFRRVEFRQGIYRFDPNAPNLHVIFGWLQIDAVLSAGPSTRREAPEWARYHTHFYNTWNRNTVYLAGLKLMLPGFESTLSGGGVFPCYQTKLCLTAPGKTRSVWRLPRCFAPTSCRSIMSYHHDINRWKVGSNYCEVRSVGKGQEFVIDSTRRPGILDWVRGLFSDTVQKPVDRSPANDYAEAIAASAAGLIA